MAETGSKSSTVILSLAVFVALVVGVFWYADRENTERNPAPEPGPKPPIATRPDDAPRLRNPVKPPEHWSNNPKYEQRPPNFDDPAEHKDAVEHLKDSTENAIRSHNNDELQQIMAFWTQQAAELRPTLEDMVKNAEMLQLRSFALKVLGELNVQENREWYKELTKDPFYGVRHNAFLALANLGGSDVPPLLEQALNDEQQEIQLLARDLLSEFRDGKRK